MAPQPELAADPGLVQVGLDEEHEEPVGSGHGYGRVLDDPTDPLRLRLSRKLGILSRDPVEAHDRHVLLPQPHAEIFRFQSEDGTAPGVHHPEHHGGDRDGDLILEGRVFRRLFLGDRFLGDRFLEGRAAGQNSTGRDYREEGEEKDAEEEASRSAIHDDYYTIQTCPLSLSEPFSDHPAVRALVAASGETACHLVGGVLRDHVLGLPVHDVDAVVAERGLEIAETLAAELPARLVLLGGKDFAAYRLVGEDTTVDLWDRAGTSLHEDLARRDFTVNSIALDARAPGEVTDPFGGLEDLERRVLRATTSESFTGDPLRVLRLPRLLLRLPGFTADPETLDLARRSSAQLSDVAAERVRDELTFLFDHPEAHRGFALLVDLDVYPGLWIGHPGEPGLSGSGGAVAGSTALPRTHPRPAPARPGRRGCHGGRQGRPPRLHLRPPAAFPGRPRAGRRPRLLPRRGLHDPRGRHGGGLPPQARRACRTTRPAAAASSTAPGAAGPPRPASSASQPASRRVWRGDLGPLVDLARREGDNLFDPPRLLTGEEVQALLGVPPGPEVGKALAAVRKAQVEGKVRTREEAEGCCGGARSKPFPHLAPRPGINARAT